jgi:DNA-binding CsgD family transcriptional regulator
MSDTVETAPLAVARDRSEARRAARQAKARRERRIIELLNRGVSVAEIAEREDVGEKHMRALVRDVLNRRMPQPPIQFIATQVNRLEEALRVSLDAMSRANLQAVDRVSRSCASSTAITAQPRPSAGAFPMPAPKSPRKPTEWLWRSLSTGFGK